MMMNDQTMSAQVKPSSLRLSMMPATSTVDAEAMRFPSPWVAAVRRRSNGFAELSSDVGRRVKLGLRPLAALAADPAAGYSAAMQIILPILVVIAMLATLGTLLFGVFWMARGGDPKRANAIMRYRIWFQGTALLLFFIFMMLYRR